MAKQTAARRVSKQGKTPTGMRSRRGRLTAVLPDDFPIESDEFTPLVIAGSPEGEQSNADASGDVKPSSPQQNASQTDKDVPDPSLQSMPVEVDSIVAQVITTSEPSITIVQPSTDAVQAEGLIEDSTAHPPESQDSPAMGKNKSLKLGLPTPMPSESPNLSVTEDLVEMQDTDSSELSSAPPSVGSTPEGTFNEHQHKTLSKSRDDSPTRKSQRIEKRTIDVTEAGETQPAKRRKISSNSDADILPSIERLPGLPETLAQPSLRRSARLIASTKSPAGRKRTRAGSSNSEEDNDESSDETPAVDCSHKSKLWPETDSLNTFKTPSNTVKQRAKQPVRGKQVNKTEGTFDQKQLRKEKSFYKELAKEVSKPGLRHEEIWTQFNQGRPIMYGSDAQTQYTPAYATEPPSRRGGRGNGRGAARGRGNAGNGRGRAGKGRGKGRDEDNPEPPQPSRTQTQEDLAIIKHAKARQAELRRFFGVVTGQQSELLDIISARDLTRLAKKPKAHRQVPEYDDVVEELRNAVELAEDMITKRYKFALDAEQQKYEAEVAVVEDTCKNKIRDIHDEYKKGAQGDLIIFRRAIQAAHDETRTQDGSEADYFPHYHDFPEPDQSIRGYSSTRITDEKPFKHHLLTYDDEARKEVIDDDVGPIIQAFARKNAERRAEEERKKTQTMEALSEEAEKQLKEMRGYLIPRPILNQELSSYALSCLADVSEWLAHQHPNKQYVFMPLEEGDTFPREALNYDRLPGRGVKVPPPPPPHQTQPQTERPPPPPPHRSGSVKPPPLAAPQPTRRSLRNLQPNGPVGQSQTAPTTPVNLGPAPQNAAPVLGPGTTLAPAPPKLAPAPSLHQTQQRSSSMDARSHVPTPPEQSPVQPPPNQPQLQPGNTLPPLQPRHMSQGSSLPPPPPLPYGYPQPYSPTHPPPQSYPPPPHHTMSQPYPQGAPSPYAHHTHQLPPSPYGRPPQPPYQPYGPPQPPPPPYYNHSAPPPPQQQYSFMPPQQGPAPPQSSPAPRPQSRARSNVAPPPVPLTQPQGLDPFHPANQNGYHHRSLSHPFQPQQPPPSQAPPVPIPHTSTAPTTAKGRAKNKAKQPVTFVNQTLATRKAAAEQLAKEEAAAAAEKKEKDKDKAKAGNNANANGRKLAPKV